jgi:glycosyltransferase involved in cell wall biosynthesis
MLGMISAAAPTCGYERLVRGCLRMTHFDAVPSSTRDDVPSLDSMGIEHLAAPALDPLFRQAARIDRDSAWFGHVPFAHWLVRALKPRLLVELGTHTGVSYTAFCQAVQAEGFPTRCFAVDTWRGDDHAGHYPEEVFNEFAAYHDSHFADFSRMLRCTFDDACETFDDTSIDLLHIDGFHTYEAVKGDFTRWLPKLSARGVVLFHDSNEYREGFGVWRFWDQISAKWPSFGFTHAHGLGVLCTGAEIPDALQALCSLPEDIASTVRSRFARLGERWQIEANVVRLSEEIAARDAQIAHLRAAERTAKTARAAAHADAATPNARLTAGAGALGPQAASALRVARILEQRAATAQALADALRIQVDELQRQAATAQALADALRIQVDELQRQVVCGHALSQELTAQLAAATNARDLMLNSTAWRLTWPARRLAEFIPQSLRQYGRRASPAAWLAALLPGRSRIIAEPNYALTSNVLALGADGETRSIDLPVPNAIRSVFDETPTASHEVAATPPSYPFDGADAEHARGLPASAYAWPAQEPEFILDEWAAARWVLDLLHNCPNLRRRFPRALSDGAEGAFATWITGEGGRDLHLTGEALLHITALLSAEPAARARQYYFSREDLRAAFPLALLPPGSQDFARWMLEHHEEGQLRLEEVWWLLLQCGEDPAAELVRTYLFTPAWQQAHPDGLTLFGRDDFAAWLIRRYALPDDAEWMNPRAWPVRLSAVEQVRLAYGVRDGWRLAHPYAFRTETEARALLTWLATDVSGLSREHQKWCAMRLGDETAAGLASLGANIVGHFCYPSGLRVSVEALAEAIELAGGAVTRRSIRTGPQDDPHQTKFGGVESYDITIIHIQPEPFFRSAFARSDLAERTPTTYRIAYWYWELEEVPPSWAEIALAADEIWVATKFVADALRTISPIPVHILFPGVRIGAFTPRSRYAFGLPGREEGRFAFLFSFHLSSVMERKNPLGLIRAFRQAFQPDEPVDLVLKTTSFGHDAQMRELHAAAAGANIIVLDQIFTSDETLSLMDACDAYVSLHRSEGLGLTMAEAMLLGKPVIATRYSGNLDFMDEGNSLLVEYDTVPIGRPVPPYDEAAHWANPSTQHAAQLMRRLYDDRAAGRELGKAAQRDALTRLNSVSAGKHIVERLAEIRRGFQL